MQPEQRDQLSSSIENEDRRKFLASCGKFAAVTPPAITMLLSTSLTSDAVARSQGGGGRDRDHQGGQSGGGSGRHIKHEMNRAAGYER
jgi:hypothetical protein